MKIQFTPRLDKEKIRKIYEDDAKGLHDESLLEDVSFTLYMRCLDIIAVTKAKNGFVRCQKCWEEKGDEVYIERPNVEFRESKKVLLVCPQCGFEFIWGDFVKAYQKNQLNSGGAMPAFEKYVREYPKLKTTHEKMLLIDYLIHEFHYSLRSKPHLPTRSVGPNLIKGRLIDIMAFLDELTYKNPEMQTTAEEWKSNAEKFYEINPSYRKGKNLRE